MRWTEVYSILQTFHSIGVVVHGAAQPNNQCTNFLNGLFRHYAFPIKSLKLIQIEPIQNPKRIQVEPIRIFSQTHTFNLSSANQNILAHLLRRNILEQWWLVRAGWCPCQCCKEPVYNFLGGFACPWLVCISYPETPPWMLGCLHRPAPVGLFFENKSHPWEQAFLLDLTRHPPLHADHSDWHVMTGSQPWQITEIHTELNSKTVLLYYQLRSYDQARLQWGGGQSVDQ